MDGMPTNPGKPNKTGKLSKAQTTRTRTVAGTGSKAQTSTVGNQTKMTLHLIACTRKQAHMVQDWLVLTVPLAKQHKTSSSLTVVAAA